MSAVLENVVSTDRPLSRSLRDIASLINSSVDLETTLRHLVYAACHNTVWAMAGVMSADQESGHAVVVARHDPNQLASALNDRWDLATSPARLALTRNEAVIIRDAQTAGEYPGYQKEAFQRGYHTVAVLPLGCKDSKGRVMVLSVQSRQKVDLTEADLAFLETIVHLGAIAVDKANRVDAERAQAQRLQNVLAAHSSLMRKVLSDGSVASATQMIETLLPNPIVAVDLTANLVVAGRSPDAAQVGHEAWREAMNGELRRKFLKLAREAGADAANTPRSLYVGLGDKHLHLTAMVERLQVDEETVGALFLFPQENNVGDLDHLLLDSAKFALSVQMMRSYLLFRSQSQTSSELFGEIMSGRWQSVDDITGRARRRGIDIDEPARLVAVGIPAKVARTSRTILELHRSIMRIVEQQMPQGTVTALGDIIICRLPGGAREAEAQARGLVRKIIEEAQWILDDKPIVFLSKPCQSLPDYPAVWRECERMIRLATRFERNGLLSLKDFGPFPALLSAADSGEVRSFVDSTIGAVVRHDLEQGTDYMRTLATYLGLGCRHQACADEMGLHVTTLRYRLARIGELFGIEMDTPERRFSLELAIRLHETLAEATAA